MWLPVIKIQDTLTCFFYTLRSRYWGKITQFHRNKCKTLTKQHTNYYYYYLAKYFFRLSQWYSNRYQTWLSPFIQWQEYDILKMNHKNDSHTCQMHKYLSLSCLFLPLKYSYLFLLFIKTGTNVPLKKLLHGSCQYSSKRSALDLSLFLLDRFFFFFFFFTEIELRIEHFHKLRVAQVTAKYMNAKWSYTALNAVCN